jgi:hypothetical protein
MFRGGGCCGDQDAVDFFGHVIMAILCVRQATVSQLAAA